MSAESEFLGIFRDEANERLDSMVEVLLALEAGTAAPDAVDQLFRDVHTIRGSSGMLELEEVYALAHAFEDVLADVRDKGEFPRDLAAPLMRATDALRAHVNGEPVDDRDVLAELGETQEPQTSTNGDAPSPEEQAPQSRSSGERRTIRVPAEKLDRLLDLVGETVLHRRRLQHGLAEIDADRREGITDELDVGERLLAELQDAAMRTRTLPLGSITGPLPRAIRDAANAEGKEVELTVSGAETELDRVILESLSEPLVHILRNAVAHGIESPRERERAGKPRRGLVELSAEQRGSVVAVSVRDDGRGVSEQVRAEATQEGSLAAVLTRPGFSTKQEVSELAGRGVGLDAVRAHVEAFGGQLEIESEPSAGTTVTLLLPLTLALVEVLLFERGSSTFGLPLASVHEAVSVSEVLSLTGRAALDLRGESLPLVDLCDLLHFTAPAPGDRPPALVVAASGRRVGVVCDSLAGEAEVVVKSLGSVLGSVPGYLGAAILGDGGIALLLDPTWVIRESAAARVRRAAESTNGLAAPKLLVVEDSFAVRELQRTILEAAGYRVETAKNGKDALERLSRDGEISLVVTDVDMPEMNGLELTREIRARPDRSSLPVVIVSAQASEEDRRRGAEVGADAYMVKRNFDQQALLETVGRLVGA